MWKIINIETGKTKEEFESYEDAEDYIYSFYGKKAVITEYDKEAHEIKYYLERKAC